MLHISLVRKPPIASALSQPAQGSEFLGRLYLAHDHEMASSSVPGRELRRAGMGGYQSPGYEEQIRLCTNEGHTSWHCPRPWASSLFEELV